MSTHVEREDDGQGVLVPDSYIPVKTKTLHAYADERPNGREWKTLCGKWRRTYEFGYRRETVTCAACLDALAELDQQLRCADCGAELADPFNQTFCEACALAHDAENEQDGVR